MSGITPYHEAVDILHEQNGDVSLTAELHKVSSLQIIHMDI